MTSINQKISDEESKKIMIKLLDYFVEFCNINKLKYSLTAGTLLGSIRHQGFIPWDDDLDVMMPRDDYKYFVKRFPRWSKKKNIKLVNPKSRHFYMAFSKIIDTNTIVVQENRTEKIGVWMDVFPVDYVENNSKQNYDEMLYYAKELYYLGDINFYLKTKDFRGLRKLKPLIVNFKRFFSRLVKKRYFLYKQNQYIKNHYGSKSMCFYSPAVIKIWSKISNVSFNNLSEAIFEGKKYKIISNWDEYLTIHYGDYLVIPPIEERVIHKCQIKQIKV